MARSFISVKDVVEQPAYAIQMGAAPLRIEKDGQRVDLQPHQTYRLMKRAAGKLTTVQAAEVEGVLARREHSFSATTRSAMLTAMGQLINTNGLDEIVQPAQRAIC